ncbi:hypothetical protein E8E14_007236 [Neopestalotiopsis sp. 37M]|nr:hypothetical protein E8E14_007236 [Neopestalotiopsis sp. 37M]
MTNSTAFAQIYRFPSEFVENLHVLENGSLLVTTMESSTGLLYTLDPMIPGAQPKLVTAFEKPITALTGIAPLPGHGDDIYAVAGGLHTSFAFERGTMSVQIVSLKAGKVIDSIPVPNTATLNGMTALPRQPHLLLSADSIDGRIFCINTITHEVTVVLEDYALGPGVHNPSSGVPPIGINGIRARGDYIYFTNSSQGTFVRVRVNEYGHKTGDFEILARSPEVRQIYDDFCFDDDGNAFVAVHSTAVFKITPDGAQTTFAGGLTDSIFKEPTSVALAKDGKSIYVSTGGNFRASPREGGQIIQVHL